MVGGRSGSGTDTYTDIAVVGGGCYGAYYVRQLGRAAAAGAVRWKRLLVIDRDPQCLVAREPAAGVPPHTLSAPVVIAMEWDAFFDDWLPALPAGARDAIVPSPLMPNVLFGYLQRRAMQRWPARVVAQVPLPSPVGAPWERPAPDGAHYVSHATWTCPINCIEPAMCPHTRDVRDWTMPDTLAAWAETRRESGESLLGPFTFHCGHRTYGVGMIDTAPIAHADAAIAAAGAAGPVRALIATASHCHGVAGMLAVGEDEKTRRREDE